MLHRRTKSCRRTKVKVQILHSLGGGSALDELGRIISTC